MTHEMATRNLFQRIKSLKSKVGYAYKFKLGMDFSEVSFSCDQKYFDRNKYLKL